MEQDTQSVKQEDCFLLFRLFGSFVSNVLKHTHAHTHTLTRIFIILFGDPLQQCVQSECVILHDPVGDAAEERVGVQPRTVVTAPVAVTAQHFLIKEALTRGRVLKVGLVKSCYDHGQLKILHLLHEHLHSEKHRSVLRNQQKLNPTHAEVVSKTEMLSAFIAGNSTGLNRKCIISSIEF